MPRGFSDRLRMPPSVFTGGQYEYMREIWYAINAAPRMSFFSGTTPNSAVSGYAGDLAINLVSGSTDTRVWVLGGNPSSALTNRGWVTLRTGPA